MTQIYDTLMDRLAALAVEAVQHPVTAVQVYWLARVSTTGHIELPVWAQTLAPCACVQLLQHGTWLQGGDRTTWPTPAHATWDDLRCLDAMTLRPIESYQPYVTDIGDYTSRLWQAACRVHGPRPSALRNIPEEVLRGAVLFDAGCYFACHEYFETLWGRVDDAASAWYQGLIQIAVAMRHLESHHVRGALKLLQDGLGRLQRYPAAYKGLDLTSFHARCRLLLQALQTLPNAAAYTFDPAQVPRLLVEGSPEA